MAKSIASLVVYNDTDDRFRTWGKFISDALGAAGGLVRVYQSFAAGTSWADVTRPTAASQVRVTEVYRCDDALQAESPVFLKVEYGASSNLSTPGVWATLGTAHDGAGALTGLSTSDRIPLGPSTTALPGFSGTCRVAVGPAWAAVAMNVGNSTTYSWGFFVERCKDAAGADAGDQAVIYWCTGGNARQEQVVAKAPAPPAMRASSRWSGANPPAAATYGADLGIGVLMPGLGRLLNPARVMALYNDSSFVDNAEVDTTLYGEVQRMVALGSTFISQPLGVSGVSVLMRWE